MRNTINTIHHHKLDKDLTSLCILVEVKITIIIIHTKVLIDKNVQDFQVSPVYYICLNVKAFQALTYWEFPCTNQSQA